MESVLSTTGWSDEAAAQDPSARSDAAERCSSIDAGLLTRLQAAAFKAAPNALLISDREGVIVWCNPSCETLTGYSCDELIGRNTRVFKSGAHNAGVYEGLWRSVLAGESWQGRLINRHADGSFRREELTAFPLAVDDEPASHFVSVRRDISQVVRLECRRRRLQRDLAMALRTSQEALRGGIEVLADLADHHSKTLGKHAHRVASLSIRIAGYLNCDPELVETVEYGALLHDIGKVVENQYMGRGYYPTNSRYLHAPLGDQLLAPIPGVEEVRRIVRHHHEAFNGSGQPDGLTGEAIPLGARIVAVANCFDKLKSGKGRTDLEALEVLQPLGGVTIDPMVVYALDELVREGLDHEDELLVSIRDLRMGMLLVRDVETRSGDLVIPAGTTVTGAVLQRVFTVHQDDPVIDRLSIRYPT